MRLLYRIEELRVREAQARAGLPPATLMQRAGRAAARAAHEGILAALRARAGAQAPRPARVLVLCGPGDNGGDGFECALALRALGHECQCWAPLASGSTDARTARQRWAAAGGAIVAELPAGAPPVLVIDALLGIGAARPLAGVLLEALRWAQARALPVLALDVPSGLDADTGTWIGGVAGVPARLTVTFLGDKPGLHLRDGRSAAGQVQLALLDVAPEADGPARGRLNAPACFEALLRPRAEDANKGSFGTVSVLGGASGMVGAVLLAGRAALRLGAGKVFVDAIGAADLRVDPLQPELMLQPARRPAPDDVLVAGCGMGAAAEARERLRGALAHAGPAVFDADALNLIAADEQLRTALAARSGATVLTPHPGEAARLLQVDVATVQRDRVASAAALAQALRAIVVLKGAGTVIAEPGGRYTINPTGGPALASAGTGDVLAGMSGAFLAQCADATAACCAAVWLHGAVANRHGDDVGLLASDIAALAARQWARLRARSGAVDDAAALERDASGAASGQVHVMRDEHQR